MGFVIHGCVDGYSRKVVFLGVSTNNKANSVFSMCIICCRNMGFSIVLGIENIDLALFIFSYPSRGPGRRSYNAGKNCHNQRIERFRRNRFHGCTFIFYYVFWYLEETAYLGISNYIHLFPFIMFSYQKGYDNHSLRSESNMTPIQLWVSGVTNTFTPNYLVQSNVSAYGIETARRNLARCFSRSS